ncbi:MAG: hypothetical protein WA842_11335 [Croceibacterium sp.]
MNSIAAALAPILLLLPALGPAIHGRAGDDVVGRQGPQSKVPMPSVSDQPMPDALRVLEEMADREPARQVRIEQRVIIRISPGASGAREQSMAALPRRPLRQQFQEEKFKDCVPISTIVGVEPGPNNRLMLFMSDRRVLSAELDRSCNARDFYSGFYIERNEDGRLCSGRDNLQSRAGASCGVAHLYRLVAVRD